MPSPIRIVSRPSKPAELERDLEESIKLIDLARDGAAFVRPEQLPTLIEQRSVHAQLARLCREGKPR